MRGARRSPDQGAVPLDGPRPSPDSGSTTNRDIPLDLKQIRQIVELMEEHGLTVFHLEKKDFNIKLKKGSDLESLRDLMGSVPMMPAAGAAPAAVPAPAASAPAGGGDEGAAREGDPIESPMVGTFYRKPSPDAAFFVNVGDSVSEGQVLCIIEAMKVMNEIKAERSGTIVDVSVEDGTPVQFGDELFRIK